MRTIAVAVFLGMVGMIAGAEAQSVEKICEVEGISEYRLDNGCRVLLFPDQSKPLVTVNMTIFVGSRHEGYGETGMAHLLEHLMFKGTPTHPNIPKEMKDRGATNFNGTTWYDRTNYYETLPANDENLEWGIRLEADRLVNSFIRGEDLASEMTVVRNEFERGENDPQRILMQRIMATAFEWHNYGKSTIGNRDDIERVPIKNLREFYQKYYRVDNVLLVIAGKFEPAKALALAEKYFGSLTPPATAIPQTYTQEPVQDGERLVTLRRTGDIAQVGAGYHIPAASHPDFAAVEVLSNILGMRPAGRLYKELVEKKIAAQVSTFEIAGHDPGMLLCFAEVPNGQEPSLTSAALVATVEGTGSSTIQPEEVSRAVAELIKQREDMLADTEYLAVELSEWAAYGDWRLFYLHRDRLEQVTPQAVQEVAARYLIASNRTLGIFMPTAQPQRARIPEGPAIATMVAGYQGREKVAEGEDFDVSPDHIEHRTTRGRLASGLRFALLPKKTKGEKVVVQLNLRFGNAQDLADPELNTACDLLADLMTRGTQALNHEQIDDRWRELKSTLSAESSTGEAGFLLDGRRATIVPALQLLRQILREPSFSADEFEILRRQEVTQVESRKSEPMVLASEALRRKLMPYPATDVRYIPTSEERIERLQRLSVADVRKVYEQFLNGGQGEIAVVGDFDPAEVQPVLEAIVADWKSPGRYAHIDLSVEQGTTAELVSIETPDKANAMYVAGLALPLRDDDENFEAMYLGNNILGGGALSNRLANRIRQQDGLSYAVGSQFSAELLDRRASFLAYAIMNPENREKVLGAVREELERIRESGVTSEELENAKAGILEQLRAGRSDEETLASMLQRQLATERTMDFTKRREARIASMTKEQVDAAVRQLVDLQQLIQVTAGDFQGAAEKQATQPVEDKPTATDGSNK